MAWTGWYVVLVRSSQAQGFRGSSEVKNPPANAGDAGSIPDSERPAGEGHGSPLQCSCLGNPMDRGAWWAAVPGLTESLTGTSD